MGPFELLSKNTRKALMDQGEQLVHFVGPDTASCEVRFEWRYGGQLGYSTC
jgi:hypothetical protein